MNPSAAPASSTNLLATHLWHGIASLGFVVLTIGGIAIVEWRQRRQGRPAPNACGTHEPRRQGTLAASATGRMTPERRAAVVTFAALSCMAAAAVHFVVMPTHFAESALYGLFFLVTATSQVGYAVLLIMRPSRSILSIGLVANSAVVALWLMTRLIAIPLGPAAGTKEEFSGLDVVASGFEIAFIATAAAALLFGATRLAPRRIGPSLMRPSTVGFVMAAGMLIGVTTYAAPPT